MIRTGAWILAGYLLLVLQTALLPHLLLFGLKPDLLLPLVVRIGMREGELRGGLLAYGLGCLEDVYTGTFLGLNGAALLLVFLTVRGNAHRLNTDNSLLVLFLVGCGTLLQAAVQFFALGFFLEGASYGGPILGLLPLQLLANLAGALLLQLAVRPGRRPSRRPGGWRRLERRHGA
jgi:rod shape-determining protein MreD